MLCRGRLPAPVLFIGEAPGPSEDVLGVPFIGPAGHLLDRIIEASIGSRFSYALTNLIACIPTGEEGDKIAIPPEEAIAVCRPRLQELVWFARPRLIVLVGALAKKHIPDEASLSTTKNGVVHHWLAKGESLRFVEMVHPAAILRADISQRGLAIQRCIVTLEDAVAEL